MAVYSALVFLYLYDEFVLSVELLVFDCFVFITHILGAYILSLATQAETLLSWIESNTLSIITVV